jgi:hypothetical protein
VARRRFFHAANASLNARCAANDCSSAAAPPPCKDAIFALFDAISASSSACAVAASAFVGSFRNTDTYRWFVR